MVALDTAIWKKNNIKVVLQEESYFLPMYKLRKSLYM